MTKRVALRLEGHPKEVVVRVARGLLREELALGSWPQVLPILDEEVYRLHGEAILRVAKGLGGDILPPMQVPGAESSKRAAALPAWWRALAASGLCRGGVILAAGGGVTLDLAGFLAATWLRGVSFLSVPTTLLAMVDAALGGKTGVNLDQLKNQVGAFWHPKLVLVDPDLLVTLPPDAFRSGLGELLKTAWLAGGELLEELAALTEPPGPAHPRLPALIAGCLSLKARVVAEDEREEGKRRMLNLGHTVGHVLESLAQRQGRPLPHGLAVAAGLHHETAAFGQDPNLLARLDQSLEALGLVEPLALEACEDEVRQILLGDKKRLEENLTLPLLVGPGRVEFQQHVLAELLPVVLEACA